MALPAIADKGVGTEGGAGRAGGPTGLPAGKTLLAALESATSGRPRTMRAAQARTSIGSVRPNIDGRRFGARLRLAAHSSEEQAVDRPSDDSPSEIRIGASAGPTPPNRHFLGDFALRFGLGLRPFPPPIGLGVRAAAVGEFLLGFAFPCCLAHAMSSGNALSGCGNLQGSYVHFGPFFTR